MGTEEYLLEKFYKQGYEEGLKEAREEYALKYTKTFIKNLLTQTDLDDEKIAFLANVNSSLVKEIKVQLALS